MRKSTEEKAAQSQSTKERWQYCSHGEYSIAKDQPELPYPQDFVYEPKQARKEEANDNQSGNTRGPCFQTRTSNVIVEK